MTVDEIKTKYHAEKLEAEIKHEIRDSALSLTALLQTKALVLQDLRSIEAYVKKYNDVKFIRNQIERIYPRMIGHLK